MKSSSEQRVCFILGIDQRSGTNFLYRLLDEHPNCIGPGPIWEDKFLKHSYLLSNYTERLFNSWNPTWEIEKKIGGQDKLLKYFGDAIEKFLCLQLNENTDSHTPKTKSNVRRHPKILLSKTPTVECLDNFFRLFPDAYLVVLVRDGRAVVESGVTSFGWDYEGAIQRWRTRANIILRFKEKYGKEPKKFLLVKYEDLVTDEKNQLDRIFRFIGVDPERYNYDEAASLGVTGSSELRKQTDNIHWQVKEKKVDFNPLARFSNWDKKMHERFNWVAGEQLTKLGYEISEFGSNKLLIAIRNNLKNLTEHFKTFVRWVRSMSKLKL